MATSFSNIQVYVKSDYSRTQLQDFSSFKMFYEDGTEISYTVFLYRISFTVSRNLPVRIYIDLKDEHFSLSLTSAKASSITSNGYINLFETFTQYGTTYQGDVVEEGWHGIRLGSKEVIEVDLGDICVYKMLGGPTKKPIQFIISRNAALEQATSPYSYHKLYVNDVEQTRPSLSYGNPRRLDTSTTITDMGDGFYEYIIPNLYLGTPIDWRVEQNGADTEYGNVIIDDTTTVPVYPTAGANMCTFTIHSTPTYAFKYDVTDGRRNSFPNSNPMTGDASILVQRGTTIEWSVESSGYDTSTGTITLTGDTTINVELSQQYNTIIFNVTPSDASIYVYNYGYITGNTYTVPGGTSVTYRVEKAGYITKDQQYVYPTYNNYPVDITLEKETTLCTVTFDPVSPSGTKISINGNEISGYTYQVADGTKFTYSASADNYKTTGDEVIVSGDMTIPVRLLPKQFTLTINPTPSSASVTIDGQSRTSITVDYGTTVYYIVSAPGYTSKSKNYTVTKTETIKIPLDVQQATYTFYVPIASTEELTFSIGGQTLTRTNVTVSGTAYAKYTYTGDLYNTYTYTATPDHYEAVSGSVTFNETTGEVYLSALTPNTYYIDVQVTDASTANDVPSAAVNYSLNSVGKSSTTNENGYIRISASYGTSMTNFIVSKAGYVSSTARTYTFTANDTWNISLTKAIYRFTITTNPDDAIVTINGVERNYIDAEYGTKVSYTVSDGATVTVTGSYEIDSNYTKYVDLEADVAYATFRVKPGTPSENVYCSVDGTQLTRTNVTINGVQYAEFSYVGLIGDMIQVRVWADHYNEVRTTGLLNNNDRVYPITLNPKLYPLEFFLYDSSSGAVIDVLGKTATITIKEENDEYGSFTTTMNYPSESTYEGMYGSTIDVAQENITISSSDYVTPDDLDLRDAFGTYTYVFGPSSDSFVDIWLYSNVCRLTVTSNVSSPTIVLEYNGTSVTQNYIDVPYGATVTYTVSKTGYKTVRGTVKVINASQTKNVPLESASSTYKLTLTTEPTLGADLSTYIVKGWNTSSPATQFSTTGVYSGISAGTEIYYAFNLNDTMYSSNKSENVSGYITKAAMDETITCHLVRATTTVSFNIKNSSGTTITPTSVLINGYENSSSDDITKFYGDYGETYTYTISATGYTTASGSVTTNIKDGTQQVNVILQAASYDYSADYFTIKTRAAGTLTIHYSSSMGSLYYRKNSGTWTPFNANTVLTCSANDIFEFYGTLTNLSYLMPAGNSYTGNEATYIVYGNILSLTNCTNSNVSNFKDSTSTSASFANMFAGYSIGEAAGNRQLLDCENLVLPMTTIAQNQCYNMFNFCLQIEKAPVIKAAKVERLGCTNMFNGCQQLGYVKCTATTFYDNSFSDWLEDAKSTGTFVKSSAATNWKNTTSGIPSGWTIQNV